MKLVQQKIRDSMLVAKKRYGGTARIIDLENYKCKAADHKELMGTMFTYKEARTIEKRRRSERKFIKRNTKMTRKPKKGLH